MDRDENGSHYSRGIYALQFLSTMDVQSHVLKSEVIKKFSLYGNEVILVKVGCIYMCLVDWIWCQQRKVVGRPRFKQID